jgi:hypothetical protein
MLPTQAAWNSVSIAPDEPGASGVVHGSLAVV